MSDIAITILLFIVAMIHNFFIDKKQLARLNNYFNNLPHPWIQIGIIGAVLLSYVIMWVWVLSSALVFVQRIYEFSRYEIAINIVLFGILLFLAWKALLITISSERN